MELSNRPKFTISGTTSSSPPSLGSPPSAPCAESLFGEIGCAHQGGAVGKEGPHPWPFPHSPRLATCLSGVSTSKATSAGVSVSTARCVCACVCTCVPACIHSKVCVSVLGWCVCMKPVCVCACVVFQAGGRVWMVTASVSARAGVSLPSVSCSVMSHWWPERGPSGVHTQNLPALQIRALSPPRGHQSFASASLATHVPLCRPVCIWVHVTSTP